MESLNKDSDWEPREHPLTPTFVEVPWTVALRLSPAIPVRSRRSAAELSWRRTVWKGFLNTSDVYTWLTLYPYLSCIVVSETPVSNRETVGGHCGQELSTTGLHHFLDT